MIYITESDLPPCLLWQGMLFVSQDVFGLGCLGLFSHRKPKGNCPPEDTPYGSAFAETQINLIWDPDSFGFAAQVLSTSPCGISTPPFFFLGGGGEG